MLAYVKGTIEELEEDAVIIEQNGIGYRIYTSAADISRLSGIHGPVKMHIHMSVREDDISLFGFISKEELYMYKLLISVSGIGPKAGLAILSALSVNDLKMAIISGDTKAITRANGVGTKGAQRIIMELKDKIDLESMLQTNDSVSGNPASVIEINDIITNTALALTTLGYSQMEAMRAIQSIKAADTMTEEQLLKASLKALV